MRATRAAGALLWTTTTNPDRENKNSLIVRINDSSKAHSADFRHRAMFHHSAGIWLSEAIFGTTITLSTGRIIPTRWVGEQHVREDLGFIPSFTDWVKTIRPEPWMGRAEKIEALVDPHLAPPVLEVR
nr:hypothetical protein [Pseudorhizobium banfieldiae]